MKLVQDISEMTACSLSARAKGAKVVLVPTMGCLHDGHLKLVEKARQEAGKDGLAALSIFVNPTQFGPNEDFSAYPRDLDGDMVLAGSAGVDVVFAPNAPQMYPEGFKTSVTVDGLSEKLCGASRPGHFKGVATVVLKLFNIVMPHTAIFGKKDYQQFVIIKRLVQDLNLGVDVIGVDTVRDKDGLALSSRNAYLSAGERKAALTIPAALGKAEDAFKRGEKSAKAVASATVNALKEQPLINIEYVSAVDALTLAEIDRVDGPVAVAVAVRIGKTRLIDNILLNC